MEKKEHNDRLVITITDGDVAADQLPKLRDKLTKTIKESKMGEVDFDLRQLNYGAVRGDILKRDNPDGFMGTLTHFRKRENTGWKPLTLVLERGSEMHDALVKSKAAIAFNIEVLEPETMQHGDGSRKPVKSR